MLCECEKIYFEATRSRVTTEKRMTYIPMTVSKCNKRCEDREKRKETDHDDMIWRLPGECQKEGWRKAEERFHAPHIAPSRSVDGRIMRREDTQTRKWRQEIETPLTMKQNQSETRMNSRQEALCRNQRVSDLATVLTMTNRLASCLMVGHQLRVSSFYMKEIWPTILYRILMPYKFLK